MSHIAQLLLCIENYRKKQLDGTIKTEDEIKMSETAIRFYKDLKNSKVDKIDIFFGLLWEFDLKSAKFHLKKFETVLFEYYINYLITRLKKSKNEDKFEVFVELKDCIKNNVTGLYWSNIVYNLMRVYPADEDEEKKYLEQLFDFWDILYSWKFFKINNKFTTNYIFDNDVVPTPVISTIPYEYTLAKKSKTNEYISNILTRFFSKKRIGIAFLEWKFQRLLYIGKSQSNCAFSKLPIEIIKVIIQYCDQEKELEQPIFELEEK